MAGESKTYTQEELDALITARLEQEVGGLKANRDQLAKEAKEAKAALKNYDGVDPAEYQALKAAAADAEQKKAAAAGDFETLKKQLVDSHAKDKQQLVAGHQKEKDAADERITRLTRALDKRAIQAELTKAIAAAKGDPDLLLPYAERFVRTRETEDDYEAFVVDASGNPRIADGKGTPYSFQKFVEEDLMTKFPRAFEGTGSSGSGASKSTGGAGGQRVIAAGDNKAFIANLDAIASGKTAVV